MSDTASSSRVREASPEGCKVRLDEIEVKLLEHPQVTEALVLPTKDELGKEQLVAYVVADVAGIKARRREASQPAQAEIIERWNKLYEVTYSAGPTAPSFVGWNSSYTRQPIPHSQMQEWLQTTLDRIRALTPRKVLEIGCGVGLLLSQLAPQCPVYTGVDFSASAVAHLEQWVTSREELRHVQLLNRAATELHDLQPGSFDTVILNSVVQYFPDIEHLLTVLQEALRLLSPGGKIFVGDVRNLQLLPIFHSAVQLSRAPDIVSVGEVRRRALRAVAQETELVIDPSFFQALPALQPGISFVDVQLRRGYAENELTRYRYDVVVHSGPAVPDREGHESLKWQTGSGFPAEVAAGLRDRRWRALHLSAIPNSRLARDAAAHRLIACSDEHAKAGTVRRHLDELQFDAVDPERLLTQAGSYDYTGSIGWSASGSPDCFDIDLVHRVQVDRTPPTPWRPPEPMKPLSHYANDPVEGRIGQQLIPQLREFLSDRLPAQMIPTAWTVLKQLPRTLNGQVDRRAL